jgi:methyl-accepting chemotaxis protein
LRLVSLWLLLPFFITTQTNKLTQTATFVEELRLPTSQASQQLTSGIHHSLAALRGWMILGEEKFKTDRKLAWSQHIEPALAAMTQLSLQWTNDENIVRLNKITTLIKGFKQSQQQIESVANTLEATPAIKLLVKQAASLANLMANNITELIKLESKLEAAKPRKALFKAMADFRGCLGLGLADIRLYIIQGDEATRKSFDTHWQLNTLSFALMQARIGLMSDAQKIIFKLLSTNRNRFSSLPHQLFELRESAYYNLANDHLANRAAPPTAAILSHVIDMNINQKSLLDNDLLLHKKQINKLAITTDVSIGFAVIVVLLLASFTIKSLSKMQLEIEKRNRSIEESERMNKGIVNTSKDSILSITAQGIIVSCNSITESMFGFSCVEMVNQNVKVLMSEPYDAQYDDHIAEQLKTKSRKTIWNGAKEIIAKNKGWLDFPRFYYHRYC